VSIPINGTRMPDVAVGKAFIGTTFLRVEWMWLSLPVIVLTLSLIVWLGTIWKSRGIGAPLWRDNMLPLVFISTEVRNTATQDEHSSSSTGYTMRAGGMKVRLVNSGGEVKLVEEEKNDV
jgi:hypothetical protein